MTSSGLYKIFPFIFTIISVIIDQLTKYFVVSYIPVGNSAVALFDGFLNIVHHRNLGVAFSIGNNINDMSRVVFFIIIPIILFAIFLLYYFKIDGLTTLQRYVFAGILGGGIGNLLDRVFRGEGVVDFISVKFYGLFGMEYFPTFNIADSLIVICSIILALSLFGKASEGR
jgi:signal peptidase II